MLIIIKWMVSKVGNECCADDVGKHNGVLLAKTTNLQGKKVGLILSLPFLLSMYRPILPQMIYPLFFQEKDTKNK